MSADREPYGREDIARAQTALDRIAVTIETEVSKLPESSWLRGDLAAIAASIRKVAPPQQG